MRILIAFILSSMSLAACDEAAAPSSAVSPEAANTAAMKGAAEEECSQLTGYSQAGLKTMTAEMQTLVTREYKSCVDSVTRGDRPARPTN